MRLRTVALVVSVGVCLVALAANVPRLTESSARTSDVTAPVTAVVRNNLGQLKWVATEATDYTPLEAAGRRLYLQAGCTYCHSQHSHPVKSETRPWGTVSEPGEYAYDVPPSFGARGIAPDLSRIGVFKFRLTKGALPTDADLLRTITRGVRGTAMPAWFELPLQDRLAVIQYIKYELAADRSDPQNPYFYFEEEPPGPPLQIGAPPPPSPEILAHGREIWLQAKCWECHGDQGKGDGEKAAGLRDDWGFPIIPANLTRGLFKSGPTVTDIFRTISTGLSWHADAVVPGCVPGSGSLGACLLYPLALRLYRPAHRDAAADRRGDARGARRSAA